MGFGSGRLLGAEGRKELLLLWPHLASTDIWAIIIIVVVKHRGVVLSPRVDLDRGIDGPVEQALPIEALEPRMHPDIPCASLQVTQTTGQVSCQELGDEVPGLLLDVPGVLNLPSQDTLVQLHTVVRIEGRVASQHLVNQDPQRPPVHSLSVAFVQDDLWSQVLWGTTESPSVCSRLYGLGEAEVADLQMPLVVEEQVLGLEVTVDDVAIVKIFESERHASRIEAGSVVGEAVSLTQMGEELASDRVLQDQVKVHLILEGRVDINNEREGQSLQHLLLAQNVVQLLCPQHQRLGKHL
mmetsp:Transcript_48182/g.75254  ORF Transcript_48182/g.75254 Transcript_48182/m.75254 type:complete len:297 (+) Transcript_48182:313-1203(+)